MNRGIWYALGAYSAWGLFPIYWKLLQHVPPLELLGHRVGWSFLLLIGMVLATRRWGDFRRAALNGRVLRIYLAAGLLIGVNWLIYVWAVLAGYIVETSLGYFINPLLSVVLGVVFLGERLRRVQWLAVGLAACGVLYLTLAYGRLPWIALTLAVSFGIYGLLKKTAPLGALYGLTVETGVLFLPALGYLVFTEFSGQGAFLSTGPLADLLMVGAGLVTTLPLLMFAAAARRIPLSLIGVLQYIAPTLQFLIGVLVYQEPFGAAQLLGFGAVWLALAVFAFEGILFRQARPSPRTV
jgi:chloramphenicol-sensitive protein RarD